MKLTKYPQEEIDQGHKKWKEAYDKLEEDMRFALNTFIKNKKCKCKVYEGLDDINGKIVACQYVICKHYHSERDRMFSKRIDEIWNMNLQTMFKHMNNIQIFAEERTKTDRNP